MIGDMKFSIRMANPADHKEILAVAKQHKCTRDFGSHMFSPTAAYDKGWIRVAVTQLGTIVGFTCVRQKVRTPVTELYFIGVSEMLRSHGIGDMLLADLWQHSEHKRIGLNVERTNTGAVKFYLRHGFQVTGESLKGKGFRMEYPSPGQGIGEDR